MIHEKIRELFEQYFSKDNDMRTDNTGKYTNAITCASWFSWEAAFVWHKIKRLDREPIN